MRRLMILRHAKSDWPAGCSDHERPLAGRGLKAAPAMGRYLAAQGLIPDLVIVSSARRTQETWRLVRGGFAAVPPHRNEPRIYEAMVEDLFAVVAGVNDAARTLLMIGHNPGSQELCLDLVASGASESVLRLQRKFPTCGLAVIDLDIARWSDLANRTGVLERYVTPALIGEGPDE